MIELVQPSALAFLLAIPIIVALHLLRPRRRTVPVASLQLWQEALRARRRGFGFAKLLRNLSLLLLLLCALAAGLALAEPRWLTRSAAEGDTVVVLDVSASMQTRAGLRTRFDLALEEAEALVDALPEAGRMLVMTSGRRPVLLSAFESDRDALRRALASVAVTDEAGRPREALQLALSLLRASERGRVRFITDGAFDAAADPGSARIEYVRVGEPARNVAITRFDFRREPRDADRFQVLLTVRNYTAEAVTVPVAVELERRRLLARDVHLAAGAAETLVLPFRGRAVGRATARIETGDDLAVDDAAFAVVNVPEPRRVLLVGPGNFYLESLLEALPDVEISRVAALAADELERQALVQDVLIFDRVAAPAPAAGLATGSYVFIDSVPPGAPFSEQGVVTRPVIRGQGTSALLRDVDLGDVHVEAARRVRVDASAAGVQRLFWSDDTDLALAVLRDRTRLLYVGFDLARSNLPLQTAFPLLFSNGLDWLRPPGVPAGTTQLRAGDRHVIRVPAVLDDLIVRAPSGNAETYRLERGEIGFDATSNVGIYRYSAGEVARHFAVNLTDADESDVNREFTLPRREPAVSATDARAAFPLWWSLTALALALLALEWVVRIARPGRA